MIGSHIKVLVSKVKGDYERHLTQAKDKLCLQLISHDKEIGEFLYITLLVGVHIVRHFGKAHRDSVISYHHYSLTLLYV